jgi:hypothetical protein
MEFASLMKRVAGEWDLSDADSIPAAALDVAQPKSGRDGSHNNRYQSSRARSSIATTF